MNIDYKNYVVFPYTAGCLSKAYAKSTLDKWGDQLAFLFQNGFSFKDDSDIDEQMMLFNGFKTYDDFKDLQKSFGQFTKNPDPTVIGYKIVDSMIDYILKGSTFAQKTFVNVKSGGLQLKSIIKRNVDYLDFLFNSDDLEVFKVNNTLVTSKMRELIDNCLDAYEDEAYGLLLIKYQELYQKVLEIHKTLNRLMLSNSEKGLQARMGNVNDEIYGSSGGFNPNDSSIKCVNGSLVYELKTLADKTQSDSALLYKMIVIAKEAIDNGEPAPLLKAFVKGNKNLLSEVRKILIEVDLSGVMVLLGMKHGLNLLDDDSLNNDRAKRIAHEFSAICKYVGLNGFDIKA